MKKEKKQRKTSIFFLTWAILSGFALLLVLIFNISTAIYIRDSYKKETERNVYRGGVEICEGLTNYTGDNYNDYLRESGVKYNAVVFLYDGVGDAEYVSQNKDFPPVHYGFDGAFLENKLEKAKDGVSVFEKNGQMVFATKVTYELGIENYLIVSKPVVMEREVIHQVNTKTVITSLMVVVVSFAVAGLVSATFTKPLADLTEKSKRLATGDFTVDFEVGQNIEEMEKLAESLNYAKDEISKTDTLQKELIANVSHDFKTPITMIKAYASMIQDISGDNPEKRNKHAQVIVDEADRLNTLVLDLLDLSKLQAGMVEIHKERFDLSEYLTEVLKKYEYLQETQGYDFSVNIENGLCTYADKNKIGQVLYNLIGNAVNYTGEDKRVEVGLSQTENGILFFVKDTGKGIPESEIKDIWTRYYRSKDNHIRPVQGTGLGLSIVKAVLDRHEFQYGVESQDGKGSKFFVVFEKA